MAQDLLGALTPRQAPSLGVVPIFLAAGKGLSAALKWVKGPDGQKYLSKLKDSADKERKRYLSHKSNYDRASSPEAKARWKRRMDRSHARYEKMRLRDKLAKRGIVGEGPVLEYERNLLSMEWEDATPERKKQIESQVSTMDGRLKVLHREATLLSKYGDDGWFTPPTVEGSASVQRNVDRERANGLGGLQFTVQSPPGAARLCRLPFYPVDPADSWSGASGIDFPGDDPTLKVVIPANSRQSVPVLLQVPKLDYARYRFLGLQTHFQSTNAPDTVPFLAWTPEDICITLKNLQLYNGQQLFAVDTDTEMSAMSFDILPSSVARARFPGSLVPPFPSLTNFPETPANYARRASRFFTGLRDYPIVDSNTSVFVTVQAFRGGTSSDVDTIVPFCVMGVFDYLEDKVYGDPKNPSPSSRAGANVKLGTRDLGLSYDGKEQFELQNPIYVPPNRRGFIK